MTKITPHIDEAASFSRIAEIIETRIVVPVARQLRMKFRRMVQFVELFPDTQIVPTLSTQWSWSHFKDDWMRLLRYKAESLASTNTGCRSVVASMRCRPYRAQSFIRRFVGRCPTLLMIRLRPMLGGNGSRQDFSMLELLRQCRNNSNVGCVLVRG